MVRYNDRLPLRREDMPESEAWIEPLLEYINILSRNVGQALNGGVDGDNLNEELLSIKMKHALTVRVRFSRVQGRVSEVRVVEWDTTDPMPTMTLDRVDSNAFDISLSFSSAPSGFVDVTFKGIG